MKSMRKGQKTESDQLSNIAYNLQMLSYLIEMQKLDEAPVLYIEEVNWALGQMLFKMSRKIRRISDELAKKDALTSKSLRNSRKLKN